MGRCLGFFSGGRVCVCMHEKLHPKRQQIKNVASINKSTKHHPQQIHQTSTKTDDFLGNQTPLSSGGVSYGGPWDVVIKTLGTEGPLAFYKGLSATFVRLWPHTVLLWLGQEVITSHLRDAKTWAAEWLGGGLMALERWECGVKTMN